MVSIVEPPPPAIGVVAPGDLQVDAQNRSLWLGVSAARDPDEAILIASIEATETAINVALQEAKDYTDTKVALRALLAHTHVIDDITGLAAALAAAQAGVLPAGIIAMWKGTLISIPAGWVLCDGNNGTPDLTDKFVIGAGGARPQGSTGGSFVVSGTTDPAGFHSHGGTTVATSLTIAQMPSHAHAINDPGHAHLISDPGHRHAYVRPIGGAGQWATAGGTPTGAQTVESGLDRTNITILTGFTGISLFQTGSGAPHSHGINGDGSHQHTVPNIDVTNPYMSLAFIMKLA